MDNKVEFKASKNGPLEVTGKFIITGSDGKVIETSGPVFLCRCGGSSTKPFCDDTHLKNGFCADH
jgi:CDGSH-type Zn-finger protein